MKPIGFAPAARDEFDEAAAWKSFRQAGYALQGARWDVEPRFRRAVVPRFPYILFYRELAASVEIVAVAHCARELGVRSPFDMLGGSGRRSR